MKQQQQATAGTGQAGATEGVPGVPDGAQWEAGREAHRVRGQGLRRQQLAQHAFTS